LGEWSVTILTVAAALIGSIANTPVSDPPVPAAKFLVVACGFQRVLTEKPVSLDKQRYALGFAMELATPPVYDKITVADPNNLLDSQRVNRLVLDSATSIGWVADGPSGKTVQFALVTEKSGADHGLANLANAREPDGTRGHYMGKCRMGVTYEPDAELDNLRSHKVF
jgi:hypothetical protein